MSQTRNKRRRREGSTDFVETPPLNARILNRLFDDFGDRDPVEDYVEVSQRVRSEEMDW